MTSAEREMDQVASALGERAERGRPLGPLTTSRVGGPAGLFFRAESEEDLRLVRRAIEGTALEVLVIGNGSNLLVADAGFPGLVVALGAGFARIGIPPAEAVGPPGEAVTVRAGAAVLLPVLARRTVAAGLVGMEWAVGVPGSVGGAVRMNAGGHGAETAEVLTRCAWISLGTGDPCEGEWETGRLAFSYRHSALRPEQVVTWAEFLLVRGDRSAGEEELSAVVRWRRAHQPGGSNAGSVFTNPPGDSAGRLIEAAGLKGLRIGTAEVSTRHANFIQVDDGGSADDVRRLIDEITRVVLEQFGVRLVPEVRLVGFDTWGSGR